MMRLTETVDGVRYRIFTMELPDRDLDFYRKANVYPLQEIKVFKHYEWPHGKTVVVEPVGGQRFNIGYKIAYNIIVEQV